MSLRIRGVTLFLFDFIIKNKDNENLYFYKIKIKIIFICKNKDKIKNKEQFLQISVESINEDYNNKIHKLKKSVSCRNVFHPKSRKKGQVFKNDLTIIITLTKFING